MGKMRRQVIKDKVKEISLWSLLIMWIKSY